MKQSYKTKSVCVVDMGLFIELAVKLTEWFGKVYYFMPWQASAFPKSNSRLVGTGLDGITIVRYIWDIVDEVDLFVFPDVYLGDLQQELIRQGKLVFGSRRGDELELHRSTAKEHLAALRKYLKEHKNQFVKVNITRGDFETFESHNYRLSEPKLDELESSLGAKKTQLEFVVEEKIDNAVETGYDGFCIDGQYPATALAGIEIKDKCYLMKVLPYSKLPEEITSFNAAISPTLKEYQYRNFMSTEIRVTEDKVPYMIDFCARCGSPPSEIMMELISNLPDVMWYGAGGVCIDIETSHKWAAEILLQSAWADNYWQAVQFPPKLREFVKLRNIAKIDGEYYVVPQSSSCPEIGAVVGVGDTMEEAIEMAKEVCKQVDGYFVANFPSALDEAVEEIEKLADFGITF
jgi:hypothetical protein